MKKLLVSVITAGALSTGAYADCSGGACSNITVDYLMALNSGTIVVGTSGDESGLSCAANGGKYMYIGANVAGKNAMYSALLTAQTTKKQITIRTNDSSSECNIAYIMSK